jgi:C-terminal processing protease CtpA/Prc
MLYYGKGFSIDNLVIVGDTPASTYGKGIMQTTYTNYLSGEALKLTTAFIYQPDGKTSIHGKGITAKTENSVATHTDAIYRAVEILNG